MLLYALFKLTSLDSNYINRSVRISFADYCSFIQKKYNNQLIHGIVRNAYYDIKNNCDLIIPNESVYSEISQSVIIVFKHEFINTLYTSDRVTLPIDLFIANRGNEMPNYPLALAIYSKATKIKTKSKTIAIPVCAVINLLGGKYSDYRNPPKYWKKIYVERISNTLLKYKMLGLITSYSFLLDGEQGIDPHDCYDEPDDNPDKTNIIIQHDEMISNYEKITKHYRIYVEATVVITLSFPDHPSGKDQKGQNRFHLGDQARLV